MVCVAVNALDTLLGLSRCVHAIRDNSKTSVYYCPVLTRQGFLLYPIVSGDCRNDFIVG